MNICRRILPKNVVKRSARAGGRCARHNAKERARSVRKDVKHGARYARHDVIDPMKNRHPRLSLRLLAIAAWIGSGAAQKQRELASGKHKAQSPIYSPPPKNDNAELAAALSSMA